jgi:hypothetical protein
MRKTPFTFVDIAGQRYDKWLVLERVDNRWGRVHYRCQCDCGFVGIVSKTALERKTSKSCGCVKNFRNWNRNEGNHGKPYTKEEEQLIRNWYPVNGTRFLRKHLGRSKEAIRHKAHLLGVEVPEARKTDLTRRHDEWRDYELRILREHYPKGGTAACIKLLPKRSKNAIWVKAQKLGICLEKNNGKENTRIHDSEGKRLCLGKRAA